MNDILTFISTEQVCDVKYKGHMFQAKQSKAVNSCEGSMMGRRRINESWEGYRQNHEYCWQIRMRRWIVR